jgi:hypothetical protein
MAIVNGKMVVTDSAELTLCERQELDIAQAQIALLTDQCQTMQKSISLLTAKQSSLLQSSNSLNSLQTQNNTLKQQYTQLNRKLAQQQINQRYLIIATAIAFIGGGIWLEIRLAGIYRATHATNPGVSWTSHLLFSK